MGLGSTCPVSSPVTGGTRADIDQVTVVCCAFSLVDDLANDLEDVDFDDAGNAGDDNDGWETEDEMEAEAEQDDSDLTFNKHTGENLPRVSAAAL